MNIGVTEISPRAVQRAAEKNFKSGYYCCEALMCTIRDEFKLDVPKEVIAMSSGMAVGAGKSGCVHELMVMGSKKDNSREFDQSIVQCSNRFHVQMVGRFIKNQDISTGNHHFGQQAADFFATGKNTYFFYAVFTRKEHSAKETADISSIFDFRILCQPVCDREIVRSLSNSCVLSFGKYA